MRSSRVMLAVMLYLALDLATPIVPGIVPLGGVSLEPVVGCQTRTAEILAPALAPRDLAIETPWREPVLRETCRITSKSALEVILFRPPIESKSPAPPSSPDDD